MLSSWDSEIIEDKEEEEEEEEKGLWKRRGRRQMGTLFMVPASTKAIHEGVKHEL